MSDQTGVPRRQFNKTLVAAGTAMALAPFGILRAQGAKLRVGVLLPRSGFQGFIGQSCQKGADLAPEVIKAMLGVDVELMNADTETNVDIARTRAERLIQEGAHVLIGAFDSGQSVAIAQVAEQRGLLQQRLVADAADDGALLAARQVRAHPQRLDALADVVQLGVRDAPSGDDDHGPVLLRWRW